jgi:hypothetical protein
MTGYQSKKAAALDKLITEEEHMTKEALKLALEALDTIVDAIYVNSQQEADAVYKANDAITAIKQALATPPAAQQEQEPQVRTGDCLLVGVCASEGHKIQAQRPWVGLTDVEILNKCESVPDYDIGNHDLIQFARAIQAKLKEKNT